MSQTVVAEGRWPDFIGIGAIKAGTTWLHTCLSEHPQIFAPPTKEIQFFNDRFDRGFDWYRGLFQESAPEACCGEFTPGYMHESEVCARMTSLPDSTRLIVCLRNPIDRAFSHYMMNMRDSTVVDLTRKVELFAEAARDVDHLVVRGGFYARQLAPYFERFGKERIHCVLFEDIREQPLVVLDRVHTFLGVDPAIVPPSALRVVNPAVRFRNARLFRWLRLGVQRAERSFLEPVILRLKMNGIRDRVLELSRKPQPSPEMDAATREHLKALYAPANVELEHLVGLDLSRWR